MVVGVNGVHPQAPPVGDEHNTKTPANGKSSSDGYQMATREQLLEMLEDLKKELEKRSE